VPGVFNVCGDRQREILWLPKGVGYGAVRLEPGLAHTAPRMISPCPPPPKCILGGK